jgi:glycosyltransferase involved in cell wall biosynthesis
MINPVHLSVVVPLKDEEESVGILHAELRSVLGPMPYLSEIIFVNDGSTDTTEAVIRKITASDPNSRLINFRRNFGQTAAMAAGFKAAKGEVVIVLDGDLQNDPKDIPLLVAKLDEGYDVVSGWRKDRKDFLISRKIPSKVANVLISKLTKVSLHDYGCSLKAYRREILQLVDIQGEMHRFIPALLSQVGARITEIPVNHRARQYGQTKYSISRVVRVILDLLTVKFMHKFSTRPLHAFGLPGMISFSFGMLIALYLSLSWFLFDVELSNRPLLILAVLLIFMGAQFVTMGLLGEMLARLYYSSSGHKTYLIRSEVVGGKDLIAH